MLTDLPKPEIEGIALDHRGIQEILPHRYPFLYIDRVNSINLDEEEIECQKNISFNEPYFQGHFPSDPVTPGVIQIETMAQAATILIVLKYEEENKGKRPAFMGVDKCRFRKPVRPGDVLTVKAKIVKYRRGVGTVEAEISANGQVVSNATLMATMI
jgi:beta-hydroxyacyl-ACP dehydratase FabZ